MENEIKEQEVSEVDDLKKKSSLYQVTPLSKYLAMALFIILPFVGGYLGYTFAPEKIVEVEKEVIREVKVNEAEVEQTASADMWLARPYTLERQLNESGEQVLRFNNSAIGYSHDFEIGGEFLRIHEVEYSLLSENIRSGVATKQRDETLLINDQSKIFSLPYDEMSESNRQFSYESCCSGETYHFDETEEAVFIAKHKLDTSGENISEQVMYSEPIKYCSDNSLQIGGYTWLPIQYTDEGFAENWYHLFTDQGYVIIFEGGPVLDQTQTSILASFELSEESGVIELNCD